MCGESGRQTAADYETEIATAGRCNRRRGTREVEECEDIAGIRWVVCQWLGQGVHPREIRRSRKNGAAVESFEISIGAVRRVKKKFTHRPTLAGPPMIDLATNMGVTLTQPDVPPPLEEKPARRRRVGLIVGVVLAGLALLVGGGLVANNLIYDSTFNRLIDATATAEHDAVWLDYFMAQDCFVGAVVEGDAEMALSDGLELLELSQGLATHVSDSIRRFGELSVQGFHGPLLAARDAIMAHYEVWNSHLEVEVPLLSTLESGLEEFALVFQLWADAVVADGEPIEQTFNAAEAAFLDAAKGGAALDEVDALFTPADIACTRGAV